MIIVSEFLILYAFHKVTPLVIKRLISLRKLNPDAYIVPIFGSRQWTYFIFLQPPNLTKFSLLQELNLMTLTPSNINVFSESINRFLEPRIRRSEISLIDRLSKRLGLKIVYDYTPLGWFNQDLAILRWFLSSGRSMDFNYAIFVEYDMLLTKPVEELYHKYVGYDAAFVGYSRAKDIWYWYRHPPLASLYLRAWLRRHGLPQELYAGFFPGNMISRRVLEVLSKIPYPKYGYCEMRLPTIITALGFRCTRLDFPGVRTSPLNAEFIIRHNDLGIYHPVREVIKGVECY